MSGFFDDALNTGEIGFKQKENNLSCYDDDPEVRGTGLHAGRALNSTTAGNGSTVPSRGPNLEVDGPLKIETVHHPAHYGGDTTYEVIKVIRAWNLGFALGSAVKYIGRNPIQKVQALQQGSYEKLEEAQRKARAQRIDDLKKAVWYIQNEIKELENENR